MITKGQFQGLRAWFDEYVDAFKTDSSVEQLNIELKHQHILRVMQEITDIGRSCQLNGAELRLVEVMAMFHDIGRFRQYQVYKTFSDKRSEDHAFLGIKVLEEQHVLDKLDSYDAMLIKTAIENHNKKKIHHSIIGEALFYSKLLRDADKVDILNVLTGYYKNDQPEENKALQLDLPDIPQISPQNIRDLMDGHILNMENLNTLNDFKLLQIGWIYDINFQRSYEIIKERKYLDIIFDTLPGEPAIDELRHATAAYLEEKSLARVG